MSNSNKKRNKAECYGAGWVQRERPSLGLIRASPKNPGQHHYVQSHPSFPSLGLGPWEHSAGSQNLTPRVSAFIACSNC